MVDWLGVSVYGAQTTEKHKREENCPAFKPQMDDVYRRLDSMAPASDGRTAKPVLVLEFGETAGHPGVFNLLTFNERDCSRYAGVKPILPADVS